MMKASKSILWILCSIGLLWGCNNDDDNNREEVRDVSEVNAENDAEIVEYLQTHFYNYEEFANPEEGFDYIIRFDTIAGDNAGKIPLIDQVQDTTIVLKDRQDNDIDFKFYYFSARDGAEGQKLTSSDSAYTRINGLLLDGTVFEEFTAVPNWFDFLGTGTVSNSGVIRGFAEGISKFKGGDIIVENEDGTFEVENFGVGAFILPSGLAYFANPPSSLIPQYAPLIYTTQLYAVNEADHDRDGIPSYLEDIDENGSPRNDDTDGDRVPNYLDADDDNDGVLTSVEYDRNNDGIPDDSNNDGIPDYLDRNTRVF